MNKQLIECVPNFSEGNNQQIIDQITQTITTVKGVQLLDVDPGKSTNRTVVTFVGEPEAVVEAAFLAIQKAAQLIDMSQHTGEHPRMGATDVCPLIPIANISMQETVVYAQKLAARVASELDIPVYLYEAAASTSERKNLATIRSGEYEALPEKLQHKDWKPDYGKAEYTETAKKSGATVIGARDFLVAYNINLNTTSTRRANAVAFDVREAGRTVKDAKGKEVKQPGTLKAVKAIGWYIPEYGIAQISMNLTNIQITPIHIAFDEVCRSAASRGMRVTGSELVGLVPLKAMLDAGRYFLRKQKRSLGVSDAELIKIAVKSLGLDDLTPFEPKKKIIEYVMEQQSNTPLLDMTLKDFVEEVASESPAPGGGSIAAYVGALGVALGTMVANLSSHKRGWDDRWEEFSDWAEHGQRLKAQLMHFVDEDTRAFNQLMEAHRLPQNTDAAKKMRTEAIETATQHATKVPFQVMEVALEAMEVIQNMAVLGNPNSVSDAGVGAMCARTAVLGAYLNVQINAAALTDQVFRANILREAEILALRVRRAEEQIVFTVEEIIARL
ncbi:MAG: glutamate formimidoyltransferase [Chitinophagales bacterium]|nr:glutamate formimidoyltransferase [Chitinophagales bacterium]